jgi:hypothetical protein
VSLNFEPDEFIGIDKVSEFQRSRFFVLPVVMTVNDKISS